MDLTAELVARVHYPVPDTGHSPGFMKLEEADYDRIGDDILRDHPVGDDLWIFAYGSLMWRPGCEIDGEEPGGSTAGIANSASASHAGAARPRIPD